jgi:NADH:ubiquinone reductase (non-electrogenic)
MRERKSIVIVGFGWATASFIRHIHLSNYDIIIISPNNEFTYTPLLAQNLLHNRQLTSTIANINKQVHHVQDTITDIDFHNLQVKTRENKVIKYDYIIFAHGSTVNTFNIPGVIEYTEIMKNNIDATNIKNKLKSLPPGASIVVIGCGPTGSEIVGTLIDYNQFEVTAIDALERPLNMFEVSISKYVTQLWNNHKVQTLFNHPVSKIDKQHIFTREKQIKYDIAIWCGGVKTHPLSTLVNMNLLLESKKGIPVDNYLHINNTHNAFAIGDCADTGLPPTAQVAYQQGKYLANCFNHGNTGNNKFDYKHRGQVCYVGNRKSVYQVKHFQSCGNITYYANKFIHLYNAINMKQCFELI